MGLILLLYGIPLAHTCTCYAEMSSRAGKKRKREDLPVSNADGMYICVSQVYAMKF